MLSTLFFIDEDPIWVNDSDSESEFKKKHKRYRAANVKRDRDTPIEFIHSWSDRIFYRIFYRQYIRSNILDFSHDKT